VTRPPRATFAAVALMALSTAGVLLLYARTLGYGLFWDDFDILRVWRAADLRRAWIGPYRPWDPGIQFYRPLTSTYYALISNTLGYDTHALHAIPLVGVAVLAMLTAMFVARETGRVTSAGIAAVLVSAHPTLASSLGPWVANQYHTFMAICLVAALLIWQRRRTANGWWWRVAPWLIAAAWFKEDGLLLAIALAAVHEARAAIVGDLPRPSRRVWVALGALSLSLIAWRWVWLTSQWGYGLLTPGQMIANLLRAPRYVLLLQVGPPAVALPAVAAKALILAAAAWVLVRARTSPGARLIVTGLVVIVFANLPLVFVSSEGRWHLVGWGAVLVASGALGEWIARAPRIGAVVTLVVTVALAVSAADRIGTFAPCSADSLSHDREMAARADLPEPLRAWLASRDAACRAGQYQDFALPISDLAWGPR
jgi:hypothetical protein